MTNSVTEDKYVWGPAAEDGVWRCSRRGNPLSLVAEVKRQPDDTWSKYIVGNSSIPLGRYPDASSAMNAAEVELDRPPVGNYWVSVGVRTSAYCAPNGKVLGEVDGPALGSQYFYASNASGRSFGKFVNLESAKKEVEVQLNPLCARSSVWREQLTSNQ